ncbi:MAG: CTP synthase, partial [Myxococcota bacterium]
IALHAEGLDRTVIDHLNIWSRDPDLASWHRTVETMRSPPNGSVSIALVGKYVHLRDSYKSLHEALVHGGLANGVGVDLTYVDSEALEQQGCEELLKPHAAILVPGGFGDRGSEGKIAAIRYAREQGVPFLGICLGMQMAVVEFARHVCGMEDANSVEFDPGAKHKVIDLMSEQLKVQTKGATMRLGAYPCSLSPETLAHEVYRRSEVSERHRHRYEVNNEYRDQLEESGLVLSGLSPDRSLVEMVELPDHPYFVGCQFHPEFKSKPHRAHPLFTRFVAAALERETTKHRSSLRSREGSDGEHDSTDLAKHLHAN